MDKLEADRVAGRYTLYGVFVSQSEKELQRYFAYCQGLRSHLDGARPRSVLESRQLEQLAIYERTERLNFDDWIGQARDALMYYPALHGRCDIIEKYATILPRYEWNAYVSEEYRPCLYPVLHIVMPLAVTAYNALRYVVHGLHREVAVHIIGRKDCFSQMPITPKSIASLACRVTNVRDKIIALKNLEEIGLDLDDPDLLWDALNARMPDDELIAFLRARQH